MQKLIAACLLLPAAAQALSACEIRVRDAAFRTPRDVHRLCVFAETDDPAAKEIQARLEKWLSGPADGLNIRIERVNADDPETQWSNYGIPSAPPTMPVTALIGRSNSSGENFVIDHWDPAPSEEDLEQLQSSPIREQLQEKLGKHLAVLLYFGSDGDTETREMLRKVSGEKVGEERIGLGLIEIDPTVADERVLLSFAGLDPDAGSALYVAFGQGKLLEPPLFGEQINPQEIDHLIEQLCTACSCSKPLPMMGVDLPLVWTPELDSTVVLMDAELEDEDMLDSTGDSPADSTATSLETIELPAGEPNANRQSLFLPVLWMLGGLVLVVGVCTKFVIKGN